MSDEQIQNKQTSTREKFISYGRVLRRIYDDDHLCRRADRNAMRSLRMSSEILTEGAFWKLQTLANSTHEREYQESLQPSPLFIGPVVLCFPSCKASTDGVSLGKFLQHLKGKESEQTTSRDLHFRRLLASRDVDDLIHQLRRILKQIDRPVDWGMVFADLFDWQREKARDRVKQRWAEDFYTSDNA